MKRVFDHLGETENFDVVPYRQYYQYISSALAILQIYPISGINSFAQLKCKCFRGDIRWQSQMEV